jgi:hypothetical protein
MRAGGNFGSEFLACGAIIDRRKLLIPKLEPDTLSNEARRTIRRFE